jgi:hypothetical protein
MALPLEQTRPSGAALGATITEGCALPLTIKRPFPSSNANESSADLYSHVYVVPLTRINPPSLVIMGKLFCANNLLVADVSTAPVLS